MCGSEQHVLTLAAHILYPLHNNSAGVIWQYMCVIVESSSITFTHACRHVTDMFCCGRTRWAASPGCCGQSADFPWQSQEYGWEHLQVGSLWTFWIRLLAPARQAPFSGSHASTSAPSVTSRECVCVSQPCPSFPLLSLLSQECSILLKDVFRMPTLNNKSYFRCLFTRSLSLHTHAHFFCVLLTQLYTHRWHYSVHTRTETCDKPKHYFCISLTSTHKVWSQRASLQFVQRIFCVRGRVCESWLNIASFLFPRSSSFRPQFFFVQRAK